MNQRVLQNLKEEQKKMIIEILKTHAKERGNIVTLLQQVQEKFQYLPKDVLRNLSEKLRIPLAEIYGIATFYAQFTFNPKGKYAITCCDGTACHVKGAPLLGEYLEDQLGIKSGETTEDGLFSLETVACLGCCAISPVIVINEEYYGNLTFRKAQKILKKLKKENPSED